MKKLFNMESSKRKSNSQKSKSGENLNKKNHHGSLERLNSDEIRRNLISNRINEEEDLTDENPSPDDKNYIDPNIARCKPCSVIVERLSEKDLHDLSSKNNNLRGRNVKKKLQTLKSSNRRLSAGENVDSGEPKSGCESKNTARKRSYNSKTRKKRNGVESSDYSNKTVGIDDKSHASSSTEIINQSSILLHEERFSFDNFYENRAFGEEPSSTTSQIKDSNDIQDSEICTENSESNITRQKRFRLSLKKKIIDKKYEEDCKTQDTHTEILQNENLEEIEDAGNGSESTERTLSLLKRLRFMFKKNSTNSEDEELGRQNPSIVTLQTEDDGKIEDSVLNSTDSEANLLPTNHFDLSLRKKRARRNNETRRQNRSGKISQAEDSDNIVETSSAGSADRRKHSMKRKRVDSDDMEASFHKVKKSRKKQSPIIYDSSETDELDLLPQESSVSRYPDRRETLRCSQLNDDRSFKQKIGCRITREPRVIKDLRISVVKLEAMANPSTSKKVSNDVKTLDSCVDAEVDESASDDSQISILETKNEAVKVNPSCSNKTRDTKITDYFFKVDKSSIVPLNIKKNLDQRREDLILKKKYGISKDATVLLIDFKHLKISGSKYFASEIEKSTQEYADSFVNINFTNTTMNMLPSSSISISNNLPSSFHELLTHDKQPSTDVINLSSVHNPPNKPSHDSLQTNSVTIQTCSSSTNHKSPHLMKHTPVISAQDETNRAQSSSKLTGLLSVHNFVDEPSHDSLHAHKAPQNISDKPSRTNRKSPRVRNHSPDQSTQVLKNDNVFLNGRTPRSRKEKESFNTTDHSRDNSVLNKDLAVDQEVPEKDLYCENSSELRTRSRSSGTNVNELGNHSPNSRSNNNMRRSSEKSTKKLNSHVRKLVLSPEKRIVSVNDTIRSNESQMYVTNINNELPITNEVQENSDSMTRRDISDVSPANNELQEEPNACSVNNKVSNTVIDQPHKDPILPSIVASPIKSGILKIPLKHEAPLRRLPINSMTILSRDIMEEHSSWIGSDNGIDNVTGDGTMTSRNQTTVENESSDILPSENTKKNKTTSCDTGKNVDNNSSRRSNPVNTIENSEDANFREDNTEPRDKNSSPIKLLNSKSPQCLSPRRLDYSKIETRSSEGNALKESNTVQKNQGSGSVTGMRTSSVKIPSLKPVESIEDPIDPVSNKCIDRDVANSNSAKDSTTDSQQEGRLIIDMDESDTDSRHIAEIPPGTSGASSSNTSVPGVAMEEETSKKSKTTSGKECIICMKVFKGAARLEQHLKVHLKVTGGYCIICQKPLLQKNAMQHYLEHCGCVEDGRSGFYPCEGCKKKFKTKSGLVTHKKSEHNGPKNRSRWKVNLQNVSKHLHNNKCNVCQLVCNSGEELFSHLRTHTEREYQDALEAAMAKKGLRPSTTIPCNKQGTDTSDKEIARGKDQVSSESTKATNTKTSPTSPSSITNDEIIICKCHKDERLEISGGVIIEMALACVQCKTFFKTKKCFKDHYSNTSSKCNDKTLAVTPKMFCNKCCVISNSLPDMREHLKKHGEGDVQMKASLLCKHCNIFFFGIGSLFDKHWSEHCKDPLFGADHNSFLNKMKVKIVEPGGPESGDEDEPTECLFLADHQCQNCEKPFQIEADLEKHLKSCSQTVNSPPQVVESFKSVFKLICSMCKQEFIDKSTFDIHMERHNTIKAFLEAAKFSEKSFENNKYTCSICEIEYDMITNYKLHLIRHEVIREKFECNYCNLTMVSLEAFERHSDEHKGTLERPLACKVIFAMGKFNCQPCKLWFDNQSTLDEHITTHRGMLLVKPRSIENSTTGIIAPTAAEKKKIHVCTTCQQEFDDQLKLDAHVSTHEKAAPDHSISDPVLIHLSDDSNSNDVEIISSKTNAENEEPAAGNNLLEEQQKTTNTQEIKKPPFLRVKNLTELLPYACSKCKSEFDTKINLSKHVCTQSVEPAQHNEFNYFCKICKSYQGANDADWNRHVLSHYPLECNQKLNESWFSVLNLPTGLQVFGCNRCPGYQTFSISTMRNHFVAKHPDIYRPIYRCRVCHIFRSDIEHEIRRHEAAHFQQQRPLQALSSFVNNPSTVQPIENSENRQQPISIPPVPTAGNNTSSLQPSTNLSNPQQSDSSLTTLKSILSAPSSSLQSTVDNTKKLQQAILNPSNGSENNSPSLQPKNNSNNFQQSIPNPSTSSSSGHFLLLQSSDNSQAVTIPPVTSSGNSLPSFQVLKNFGNAPQPIATLQSDKNANESRKSNSITPVINNSITATPPLQPILNSNNFQPSVWIPSVGNSGNNLPQLQTLPNFTNPQKPGPILQPNNNPNNFQQSLPIPPVTSSGSNLPSLQTMETAQWLATTAQTLQIQISNTPTFNNMVHAVPMYVANVIYTCRICKNYKCSSEQDLKVHEALHEFIQFGETQKKFYRCKVCTDTFCPTEEHLKAHMDMYHKSDKSVVTQNQNQSNILDAQIKCRYCQQTFTSPTQLNQHIYTIHALPNQQQNDNQFQNSYPYNCQICSIGFLNESFLNAHMRQIHPSVKLPRQKSDDPKTLYECDTCGLLLISEETLNYHMKSHKSGFH